MIIILILVGSISFCLGTIVGYQIEHQGCEHDWKLIDNRIVNYYWNTKEEDGDPYKVKKIKVYECTKCKEFNKKQWEY